MPLLDIERPTTPIARFLSLVERRVPLRFAPVVAQARRDLAVVEGRILDGALMPPTVARRHARERAAAGVVETSVAETKTPVAPSTTAPKKALARVTIEDGGAVHAVEVAPGRYLLESALEQGAPMPFSCTLGGCGSCKVSLIEGSIEIEEPHCLTPEEVDAGLRLTCVGRVTSSTCRVRIERDPS